MRIIEEEQLDFTDVLIQPKCSKILSRSQVNLEREFKWYSDDNSKHIISCIPYGTSNMGTVGTIKIARCMVSSGHFACLEKHIPLYEIDDLMTTLPSDKERDLIIPSIGIKEETTNIFKLYDKWNIKMIMIDVPNGYIPSLVERIKEIHAHCKNSCIIAGNVIDSAGALQLIDAGAQIIKVGIGNGCFLGDMPIITDRGTKSIKDISVGDMVLTHNGTFERVTNKFEYNTHKEIIDINGIKCTPNHMFYVVRNENISNITKDNYQKYSSWLAAEELDNQKYKLLAITIKNNTINTLKFIDINKGTIGSNTQKTYDIEVETANSYNINGIIVHNSVCLTREKTGIGRPQLSTIMETADTCHQRNVYVMADGGITCPGDMCKAFGAGADFVISGSLFSGCEEAEGDIIEINGKKYKQYYGMSSHFAQEKHFGGIRKYSASEGREKLVPYTGHLSDIIQDIDGGLKSCCTYIGCDKMKNFSKHTTFYRVHNQLNMIYANCLDIQMKKQENI